jgi:hypothetical protein
VAGPAGPVVKTACNRRGHINKTRLRGSNFVGALPRIRDHSALLLAPLRSRARVARRSSSGGYPEPTPSREELRQCRPFGFLIRAAAIRPSDRPYERRWRSAAREPG